MKVFFGVRNFSEEDGLFCLFENIWGRSPVLSYSKLQKFLQKSNETDAAENVIYA